MQELDSFDIPDFLKRHFKQPATPKARHATPKPSKTAIWLTTNYEHLGYLEPEEGVNKPLEPSEDLQL